MGPWATKDERSRGYDAGAHKGAAYRNSEATIFVESCPIQARAIAEASGKRVICPATAGVFEGAALPKATVAMPATLTYDTAPPHLNPVGDDDPGYEAWLTNARPLWLPRFVPAPLIITYRCERHRGVTEEWLRRWGCKWDRIVMAPFDDWRERDRSLSPMDFKAMHLAESPYVGLVESHDWIARGVQEATGKVVITCTLVAGFLARYLRRFTSYCAPGVRGGSVPRV
jgi:hypothetical protein